MLVKEAEILDASGTPFLGDIRIHENHVTEVGRLTAKTGETVVNARRNLIVPGLNDHHGHLIAFAASLNSLACGPPDVNSPEELGAALVNASGEGWLRGFGYHDSIGVNIDRHWLDRHGPERPIRIQHRSGLLWILNSLALELIEQQAATLPHRERARLRNADGRLYNVDELLSLLTRSEAPPIAAASRQLAAFGVTGINDMTPTNDLSSQQWFRELQNDGTIRQRVMLSGRPELSDGHFDGRLTLGSTKVHLHDHDLPDFSEYVELIRNSQQQSRSVAVHCVTELALVYTLSALQTAEATPGHRIEHASVIPPQLIEQLQGLELGVVTQPNFIYEKGDTYQAEIPAAEHAWLYRCQSLLGSGIPLAFGTDLPFGKPDPWQAMQAATDRCTHKGDPFNPAESITPEEALTGFLGSLETPFEPTIIQAGCLADLCLLDVPWRELRNDLRASHVRLTIADGVIIYSRD